MLKIEFIGGEEVVTKLKKISPKVHDSLLRTITELSLRLQEHIIADKLSGQVLKTKTGTLRRSITSSVTDSPDQIVGRVGTNLKYGLAHEFGFNGSVNVKAHLRTIKQAFGKPIAPRQINVRAHTMKMNLPERSFLRSALRDMLPQIQAEIEKAVQA